MHSQIQLYVNLYPPYVQEKEKIMLKSALHDMKHPVDVGFKIIMVWYFPLWSIYRLVHYDSQSHSQGFLSALCNNIFLGMLLISDLLISSNRGFNSKYGRVSTLEIQTKVSKVSSMFFFFMYH